MPAADENVRAHICIPLYIKTENPICYVQTNKIAKK